MEQNTQNTALLVMDMQVGITSMMADAAPIIGTIAKAIAAARAKNIPVYFVVVGFRKGVPEVGTNNKSFAGMRERAAGANMDEFTKVHPDLAPLENEVTIVKRRVSAFTGSDLEVILRANNIQHIVLTGLATSGVVLSTLREASDKDYRITVLSDGCGDREEDVHQLLTTKVFPRQADVMTADEWMKL